MSDPRGAAAGSSSGSDQATTPFEAPPVGAPDSGSVAEPAGDAAVAGPPLDASAHAHVLADPLPPEVPDDTPVFRALSEQLTVGHDAEVSPDPSAGVDPAASPPSRPEAPRPSRAIRVTAAVLGLTLVATGVLAAYLYQSARDWRDQANGYLGTARDLGAELAQSRSDLAGARSELEAVREQLATAHERITELADEKAQIGDEREATRQLVDYQKRISDAAGQVALKLDQCVQGQQELIGYQQRVADDPTAALPPDQLAEFQASVEAFCQAASAANISLQRELAR